MRCRLHPHSEGKTFIGGVIEYRADRRSQWTALFAAAVFAEPASRHRNQAPDRRHGRSAERGQVDECAISPFSIDGYSSHY
jgi:hypothetical protein